MVAGTAPRPNSGDDPALKFHLLCPRRQMPRYRVVRIGRTPRPLGPYAALCLVRPLRAGALPLADPAVRQEPLPAEATRPLPRRRTHRQRDRSPTRVVRFWRAGVGHSWRALRKQQSAMQRRTRLWPRAGVERSCRATQGRARRQLAIRGAFCVLQCSCGRQAGPEGAGLSRHGP